MFSIHKPQTTNEEKTMTLFTNLDNTKIDSIVGLMQSSNHRYKPAFGRNTEAAFKSNDLTLKIVACARFLIRWQNELNDCKNDPYCFVLFYHDQFEEYSASQKTLDKLKRKLSRLFFEGLDSKPKQAFIIKAAGTFNLKHSAPHYVEHMFRYHGDDAFCLQLIGECIGVHPNSPAIPPDNMVQLYADPNGRPINPRHILAVGSAAEHFPLASNTWGYRDQPKSSWFRYSEYKARATSERRKQFKGDNRGLYKTCYWDNVVEMSHFRENIVNAKKYAGNPIGNCWERSLHVFHRLAKQRKFDPLAQVNLVPGDHWFDTCDENLLDAWNGPRLYPEKLKEKLLYDYKRAIDLKDGSPVLAPYHPNQKINVNAYTLYPLEAFKKDSTTNHLYLVELLKQFHQIPAHQRQEKMIKALEIVQFIEQKLPLYPYVDGAVNELYDQMLYLTKKERRNGLKPPPLPAKDRCLINEALQNLDLHALREHLQNKEKPDSLTIFHAMKACLRASDISFLKEINDVGIPIPVQSTPFTFLFDRDPASAIMKLAKKLSIDSKGMDLTNYCNQILQNR